MKMKKNGLIFMGLVVFWGSAPPAAAQQSEAPTQRHSETLVKEAVEHYSARRYEKAVELFKQAYDIEQEPEILYNIARSYERLSRNEEAVEWYQRFLDTPGTTSELRTRARTNIEMLRREMDAVKKTQSSQEDNIVTPPPDSVATKETVDTTPAPVSKKRTPSRREKDPSAAPQSEHSASPFLIAGWSTAGVGAAAIVTGSVFGGLALKSQNDYEADGYNEDRIQHRDDMERNSLVFDIVFFTGAGLTATGIALLVVDAVQKHSKAKSADKMLPEKNAAKERPNVTFSPSFVIGDGNLAGGLAGHF
jgi:tetratricopeptide (TPR) repeat protein